MSKHIPWLCGALPCVFYQNKLTKNKMITFSPSELTSERGQKEHEDHLITKMQLYTHKNMQRFKSNY